MWAHAKLGSTLLAEDLDGAIAEYREVVRIAPEFIRVRLALGVTLLHRTDDLDGAIEQSRAIIRIEPGNAAAFSRLGTRSKGETTSKAPSRLTQRPSR